MTAKEIDKLAKQRKTLPKNAHIADIGLYYKLVSIYESYDTKQKSAEEAKKEKQDALEDYEHIFDLQKENDELTFRVSQHIEIFKREDQRRIALSPLLSQANKTGCALCREIARVYDGRL